MQLTFAEPTCDKTFEARRSDARFCSVACRGRAKRRRRLARMAVSQPGTSAQPSIRGATEVPAATLPTRPVAVEEAETLRERIAVLEQWMPPDWIYDNHGSRIEQLEKKTDDLQFDFNCWRKIAATDGQGEPQGAPRQSPGKRTSAPGGLEEECVMAHRAAIEARSARVGRLERAEARRDTSGPIVEALLRRLNALVRYPKRSGRSRSSVGRGSRV